MAPCTRSARTGTRSRRKVMYKEDDSSSERRDEDTEESFENSDEADNGSRRPVLSPRSLRDTKLSTRKRKTPPSRYIGQSVTGKKAKEQSVAIEAQNDEHPVLRLGGKVPRWQELPYHILSQIFQYACLPASSIDNIHNAIPVYWLIRSARLCRAFTEPALSALYYSPPLNPPTRAHRFLQHLKSQTDQSSFNYPGKVKMLNMEVFGTLIYKYGGNDPLDLGDLITLTPQLRGVTINLLSDEPKFSKSGFKRVAKLIYPRSMFAAFEAQRIALQEWIWNSTLIGHRFLAFNLADIHSTYSFQSLRSLTFINFIEQDYPEEKLALAINSLPLLRQLSFKTSSIVNQNLLPLLPDQLELFELVNCPMITSKTLASFLASHGQNLRKLILKHNKSLNLSFLTDMGLVCPRIEVMSINLQFYNTHFINWNPKFDALLLPDEIPTWPSSLQKLELFHLRKWNLTIAESFFSSLVNSASSLPNLRHLNIKASLGESGWRDRIGFRDKWTARLQKVFLRVATPPNPHFYSIPAFYEYKRRLNAQGMSLSDGKSKPSEIALHFHPGNTKFSHVEVQPATIGSTSNIGGDRNKNIPLGTRRRSTRLSQHSKESPEPQPEISSRPRRHKRRKRSTEEDSASEDSAIDDDVEDEPSEARDDNTQEFHVQGLCNVVHVLIDNLRPTEQQLHESDFLDEEASGDEDWDGDDDMAGDGPHGPYAW